MFRPMRRARQALSQTECLELLERQLRGVLSVLGDDGYPYGMPMNHYYCPEDGKIYFHGGRLGHKIDALREHPKVSFCVYDEGFRKDGDWALNIRSVIVFGQVSFVEDQAWAMEIFRRLSRKFTDDEAYIDWEVDRSGPGTLCFCIQPEHMTGKLVNEK